MVITVLSVLAFILILLAKIAPNLRGDLLWVGVFLLALIHLLAAVSLRI